MTAVDHRMLLALISAVTAVSAGVILASLTPAAGFGTAALGAVCIAALAAAIVANTRRSRDAFSVLNATAVFYLLTFGVGGLYFAFAESPLRISYLDPSNLDLAIMTGLTSWALLAAGYLFNPLRTFRRHMPALRDATASPLVVASILLGVGWLARLEMIEIGRYFHFPASGEVVTTGSSWFITSAAVLPTLATAYLGARSYLDRPGNGLRLSYHLLLIAEILWAIPTGSRANVLTLFVMAVVIRYYGRSKRLPVAQLIVVALAAVFLVLPFGLEYRGDNKHFQSDPRQSLEAAATKVASRSPDSMVEAGLESTAGRFSGVASVAAIVGQERRLRSHGRGATYSWIAEAAVPRALHREKPDPGAFGNEFGRSYGIIAPNDRITGITVTHPGELYLNFGFLGILLGMPLIGAVYRSIDVVFQQRNHPGVVAVYAIIVWDLLNGSESILAVGVFGVLKFAAFCALALFGASRVAEMLDSRSERRALLRSPEAERL